MTEEEEKFNPWQVNFLDDFLFYCCPECDFKHDTKSSFVSHALIQHPSSRTILPSLKSKASSCDTNVTHVTPSEVTKPEIDTIETIEVKAELGEIKDEQDTGEGEPMDFNEPNEYSDYDEDDDDQSYMPESLEKLVKYGGISFVKQEPTTYHCHVCKLEFDSIEAHCEHRETVHYVAGEGGGYKCDKCDKILKSEKWWDNHNENHSKSDNYKSDRHKKDRPKPKKVIKKENQESDEPQIFLQCNICCLDFDSEQEAIDHRDSKHGVPGGWKCDKCDRILKSEKWWNNHNLNHSKDKDYSSKPKTIVKTARNKYTKNHSCQICDLHFRNRDEQIEHRETVHTIADGGYSCGKCDKTFNNLTNFLYHVKTRHSDESSTCDICGKLCGSSHHLVLHRRQQHHLYNIRPEQQVKKCDKCDTTFTSATEMDKHMNTSHDCIREVQCKECDTKWVSHLSLELHYIEEHKKIMFCCDSCDYIIYQAAILRRHKKAVHEGKRDHVCHMCGESFTKKFMLQDHLALKHGIGEVRFKCEFCGKGFLTGARRQDHIDGVHLKNKQFKCDRCPHVCYTKKALHKHQNYGRCHQERTLAILHKM